ncbi:MAG: type II CAAX endopeptidase family protein [Dehalococcoidia bacterium]
MKGNQDNYLAGQGPSSVPWTSRDAWLGLGLFLGLSILTTVFFLFLIWVFSADLNTEFMLLVGELMFIVPIWWFATRKYGAGWSSLGLHGCKWTNLAIGVGLVFAVEIISGFYAGIIEEVFDSPIQPDLEPIAEEMAFPWLLIVMAVVVAPFVEELFFRGFLFAGFIRKYGWQKAALISSILFALGHMQPFAIFPLFLLGYVFAYLYQRSGSIWPGILMHLLVNSWGIAVEFAISE